MLTAWSAFASAPALGYIISYVTKLPLKAVFMSEIDYVGLFIS